MATFADLEKLGYTVALAQPPTEERAVAVYSVSGFGITNLYVVDGDQATIASLADPTGHAERVNQFENGPPPVPAPPPSAADTVLGAIDNLDPATASVADVVNAVKTALTEAGAKPRT